MSRQSLWIRLVATAVVSCTLFACSSNEPPPESYQNGLVVSAHELASSVGVEILKQGGNAVDAAVATSYALAVVHPTAGNIGGGGFMLIRTPDGMSTGIDYREQAPAGAHPDMFLDDNGDFIQELTRSGALAAGVPGTVAGTLFALEKYGTKSRMEVLGPAVELAREGWILDRPMGGEEFMQFPSTNRVFNHADGTTHESGERWVQSDLARTLTDIANQGKDGFYKGEIADLIVATMNAHGGIVSHQDLEDYEVRERVPVHGTYRGYGVVSMPPVSSGGTTLIQLLNILERYDLRSAGHNETGALHLLAEAMRRSFADRNWYIADPDFIDVPSDILINKVYADSRAADINPDRATPSTAVAHGDVTLVISESDETTHFSVVDQDGMAVAVTTTINSAYGSKLVVEGAGFLLNNQMGDFSAKPGVPNHSGHVYGEANGIAPGKRMISSQTPTIVTKDGKNFLVLGAAGSGRIITAVLQTIVNAIDYDMSIADAVSAPRIHHQWFPDQIEYEEELGGGITPATLAGLEALGHSLTPRMHGKVHALMIDPETGSITGIADPRRDPAGAAVGY